eukprot:TRINITY_DN497_c0_g1_i3.p1 TRINITY_DN497_c0_g1~~TRINITY_DN497_c0_g1_i3.p1  ORF type:complete len:251 (+),score=43.31 TRINITY_DN497_c0_g1_i3:158-910(+)
MTASGNTQHPLGTSSTRAPSSPSHTAPTCTTPSTDSMQASNQSSRQSHRRMSTTLPPPVSTAAIARAHASAQASAIPMRFHQRPSPPPPPPPQLTTPSSLPTSRAFDMERMSSQRSTYAAHVTPPSLPTLASTQPHAYVSEAVAPFGRRFMAPSSRRVAIDSLLDARSHLDNSHVQQSFLPPIQSRISPVREPANMFNTAAGSHDMYQESLRAGKENRVRKVVRSANRVIPCPFDNCKKTFSRNSNLKGK